MREQGYVYVCVCACACVCVQGYTCVWLSPELMTATQASGSTPPTVHRTAPHHDTTLGLRGRATST